MLCSMCAEHPTDWDEYLSASSFSIREVPVTQNALLPVQRPYVLLEITEGDFQLLIYQITVQRFTIETPTMSEFEYYVYITILFTFYTIQIHYYTKQTYQFISLTRARGRF